MSLAGIGGILNGVSKIADDLLTTDEERLKISLQEKSIEAGLLKGQQDIDKAEAVHSSVFVAGWRPFIGWVGGLALAYQFIFYPLLIWIWALLEVKGIIAEELNPPPVLPTGPLLTIVAGMLGIGTMRSFDKLKKTQTEIVKIKDKSLPALGGPARRSAVARRRDKSDGIGL